MTDCYCSPEARGGRVARQLVTQSGLVLGICPRGGYARFSTSLWILLQHIDSARQYPFPSILVATDLTKQSWADEPSPASLGSTETETCRCHRFAFAAASLRL